MTWLMYWRISSSIIPTVMRLETFEIPGSIEQVEVKADYFHHILVGGDQLTTARVRESQRIRINSESPNGRLVGITEDWHTKLRFMGVCIVSSNSRLVTCLALSTTQDRAC